MESNQPSSLPCRHNPISRKYFIIFPFYFPVSLRRIAKNWPSHAQISFTALLRRGMEREFLYAPIGNFSGVHFVVGSAIEFMNGHKLLRLLAALAEFSKDAAVEFHLVNLSAVFHV